MHRLARRALLTLAPLPAIALSCSSGGCTQPTATTQQTSVDERSADRREVGQSHGVLQLVYSLTKPPRDARGRPPWLGCQLHLLDAEAGLRVAVDLGDARRRELYPRAAGYSRRPAIFPFGAPAERLQVELHTTLAPDVVHRAPGVWGRRGQHVRLPVPLPERWAFSCVLRQTEGGGSAIDGFFLGRRPRVVTSRGVGAADLAPERMRAHLRLLLR